MMYIKNLQTHNRIRRVCALATATLILPVAMAFAKHDNEKGNEDKSNEAGKGDKHVHTVPEGGPGIVLLTTAIGAVLLFGAIQRSRAEM
jgi:hypothetical protein